MNFTDPLIEKTDKSNSRHTTIHFLFLLHFTRIIISSENIWRFLFRYFREFLIIHILQFIQMDGENAFYNNDNLILDPHTCHAFARAMTLKNVVHPRKVALLFYAFFLAVFHLNKEENIVTYYVFC